MEGLGWQGLGDGGGRRMIVKVALCTWVVWKSGVRVLRDSRSMGAVSCTGEWRGEQGERGAQKGALEGRTNAYLSSSTH